MNDEDTQSEIADDPELAEGNWEEKPLEDDAVADEVLPVEGEEDEEEETDEEEEEEEEEY